MVPWQCCSGLNLLSLKQEQLFDYSPTYHLPEPDPSGNFGSPVRPSRPLSLEHFQQPFRLHS